MRYMNERSSKEIVFICILGYILVVATCLLFSMIIMLITGYYPSITLFTLALLTFRLIEINQLFLLAPLIVAIIMMTILSRILVNIRVVAGLSLTSYYVLATLAFRIVSSSEFPYEALILWFPWVFFLGYISAIMIDMIKPRINK